MIKGCKKNVVWVRNTGSEMFDEAYFIVSERKNTARHTENDMVREADRIISEAPFGSYFPIRNNKNGEKRSAAAVGKAAWFMLGASFTTALNAVICFIV